MHFGDIWIDTDGHTPPNTSDIYRYEDAAGGSQGELGWRAAPFNAVGKVYLSAAGAQSTADGKIVTFYHNESPIPTGDLGDLWINTTNSESGRNKLYRAMADSSNEIKAGEWEEIVDEGIAANAAAIIVQKDRIDITVSDISSIDGRVTTAEGSIVVNAGAIDIEVTAREGADTTLQGNINVEKGRITAEVSARQGADSTLQGQIIVNAGNIQLKVSTTDYTGSTICSKINLTSSSIIIDSKHININGECHFTAGYDPTTKLGDGEAAADINAYGTTIDGDKITTGTIEALQIAAGAITVSEIHADSITTVKINDRAVTPAKVSGVISNVAYGNYTGNAVYDRQIKTNFVCEFVFVSKVETSSIYCWIVSNADGADCICVADTDQVDDYARPCLHPTDGFKLGSANITANQNGVLYKYVAFGHDWIL